MSRPLRSALFQADAVGVYHCCNRVVRRACLTGFDKVTNKDFSPRKEWIHRRLKVLIKHFHLDLLSFALMSNHFHLVVRNRPDTVARLSDREVAYTWLMICPRSRRRDDDTPAEPTEAQILHELARGRIDELRSRLSDPSWLMRLLCQHIGQRCNAEDEQKGKFFESRFTMTRALDEQAVLAVMAYVDLNPIRAGLCHSLEDYEHVSIAERIRATQEGAADMRPWLAPLELREETNGQPVQVVNDMLAEQIQQHLEASDSEPLGCLPIGLPEYRRLLEWLCRKDLPGAPESPSDSPAVLRRQGLNPAAFAEVVRDFSSCFSTAAGCTASLAREAVRRGCCRLRGPGSHTLDPVEPVESSQPT